MRVDLEYYIFAVYVGIYVGYVAEKFGEFDHGGEFIALGRIFAIFYEFYALGPERKYHLFSFERGYVFNYGSNVDNVVLILLDDQFSILHFAVQEIHGRLADEARHKEVAGIEIQFKRGAYLLYDAQFHNYYPVGHGHGLGLVVSNVNSRGADAAVDLLYLRTHGNALLCVEVG